MTLHTKERPRVAASPGTRLHEMPAVQLDVTFDVCPITWVKTKLALEALDGGQVLELRLNDGEPLRNVPRSAKEEGHRVMTVQGNGDSSYTLTIEKDGLL